MADEDEIDVLGDYNLGNFLSRTDPIGYEDASLVSQNSDFLNCDYTIHPQWLLDKPSANPDNWYNTDRSSNLNDKAENDTLGHVSTENCITDESGWTEKEKNLLERGIEIFGKSNVRLSQFIGSKIPSEVKYYLKNFYLENHGNLSFKETNVADLVNTTVVADILDDNQIPASIEEVIAAVSTAKPTVSTNSQKQRTKSASGSYERDQFSLKYTEKEKFNLKTRDEETSAEKVAKKYKKKIKHLSNLKPSTVKFKFKTELKMHSVKNRENLFKVDLRSKPEYNNIEITTGNGCAVSICKGEEIVKFKKVEDESDTDVEVDVEVSDDEITDNSKAEKIINSTENFLPKPIHSEVMNDLNENRTESKHQIDIARLDTVTLEKLNSLEEPKCELKIHPEHITELEKVVNSEYFEGRSSKTPERYLKVRNYMISNWLSQKPTYLNKTKSRIGLKKCGDVNCLGKIHNFLEQIGAINFGCPQVVYSRPLSELVNTFSATKDKFLKEDKRPIGDLGVRHRIKKKPKFANDGEGGCTLTHDEEGKVINTTIVSEEPTKNRLYIKKPGIRLMYCRPFMGDKPQPYNVKMYLSTILTMDFHAHLSLTEVMGLVAGYWIPESATLIITHYEPTLNMASSATHCDMCPISQAKAADSIHEMELDILGWFHSHPTFAPEPSQQDLETQQTVQQWIGHKKPCIGVILSPFSFNGALIASPYRCMIVDKKANFEDQYVPYKFEVDVVSDGFNSADFMNDLKRVMKFDIGVGRVEFDKPYFLDSSFTYLEKYITSVRMQLAKCGTLSQSTCNDVIQGITQLFSSQNI